MEMQRFIRTFAYVNYIQLDQEVIQTEAVYIHRTKSSLVQELRGVLTRMWENDELPKGDSRCLEKPPSEHLIQEAIDGIRTMTG